MVHRDIVTRDIVVVAASAGGISALADLMHELDGFPGSVLAVVHVSATSPGVLPRILSRAGGLKVEAGFARDGQSIEPGHIYVARADYHLLIKNRKIELSHGPKENGFRPAADPLFRTAAQYFGRRVVGVVLSGGLDDGTDGLRIVKQMGGIAIAQDPVEALFPSMPVSAIRTVRVDHVAPVREIARLLLKYAGQPISEDAHMSADRGRGSDIAESGDKALRNGAPLGAPSMLTCPDCGGALWEFEAGSQFRYRCHVGHLYTGDGLAELKDDHLEQALWTAVRMMEEASALRLRLAGVAGKRNWTALVPSYRDQAKRYRKQADLIRGLLLKEAAGTAAPRTKGTSKNGNGRPRRGQRKQRDAINRSLSTE